MLGDREGVKLNSCFIAFKKISPDRSISRVESTTLNHSGKRYKRPSSCIRCAEVSLITHKCHKWFKKERSMKMTKFEIFYSPKDITS
jgi:hypothetical protein